MPYRTFHGFHPALGPADCPRGHYFGPGTYQTSWMPCMCPPAHETGLDGHRVWRCGPCHDEGTSAGLLLAPALPRRGPRRAHEIVTRGADTVDRMDPVTFAEARLNEDEAAAKKALEMGAGVWALAPHFHTARHDPARVLREVESGRPILERHRPDEFGCQFCPDPAPSPCPDLADLLYRWADHIDYEPAWLPDGL